ncbi:MAG: hypothetical protein HOC45_01145 [Marinovum sp.]|jgi:hypothetical protein|nr:hypothetical protein [Marinovum sp.]
MTDKNFSYICSLGDEVSNSPEEQDGKPKLSPEAVQMIFAFVEKAKKADVVKKNLPPREIAEFEVQFARGYLKRQ